MANQEQLEILKQGVDVWNKWWEENKLDDMDPENISIKVDLRDADLREADLDMAKLPKADLSGANLSGAGLSGADLFDANLRRANLSEAGFRKADLINADLSDADLREANLMGANLWEANLTGANLTGANLTGANLREAILNSANLQGSWLYRTLFTRTSLTKTDFLNAHFSLTMVAFTDLSHALNLDKVDHSEPSDIGEATIVASKGQIPESFLRGCGLADIQIEFSKLFNPDLTNEEIVKIQYRIFDLRATQALQISPLFISYSHADTDFVDHLDTSLTKKGVRFWRDIHDAKAGRLETQIDRAIRQNPTVLLVLSKNSLSSDWVEHEVRHARKLEKELGRDALCPIALDDAWKSSPWPKRIMEQVMEYNILDFSGWQDTSTFESKFAKLLGGLEIFYKKSK